MLDARIIANAVLDYADKQGRSLTNLDVQKLVYFLHGHFLRLHSRPLVIGEFEAWSYGPVHKVLYDAFKQFVDGPIEGRARAFDPVRRNQRDLPELADPQAIEVLRLFLPCYLDMPTFLMVELTHQPGTPWSETVERSKQRVNVGMKIPNDLIRARFEGQGQEVITA